MVDWPALVALVIASRSRIFERDAGRIYRYVLPPIGASASEVTAAERRLGRPLDRQLRELLSTVDGFPAVEGDDDIFGTSDFGVSERWFRSLEALEILADSSADVPRGPTVLPIGMSVSEPSLLIMGDGSRPEPVTWLYSGQVADRWPDLAAFLRAAVVLNDFVAGRFEPGHDGWVMLEDLSRKGTGQSHPASDTRPTD